MKTVKKIFSVMVWIVAVLMLVAIFLPWVRPLSENEMRNVHAQKQRLAASANLGWKGYVLIPSEQWHSMLVRPMEGVSLHRLLNFADKDHKTPRALIKKHFFTSKDLHDAWLYLLLAPMLLVSVGVVGCVRRKVSAKFRWILASGLVASYLLLRWLLGMAGWWELELVLGAGLWIQLYAIPIIAGCLIARGK